MDSLLSPDDYLSALSAMLGADRITLDEDGFCQFQHESGFTVTLIWQGDEVRTFTLSSDVLDVPPAEARLELYARLLRLNFLLIETGGATLAVDENEHYVFLCRELPLSGLDETRFIDAVTGFIVQAAEMRADLGGADLLGDRSLSPVGENVFDPFAPNVIRS